MTKAELVLTKAIPPGSQLTLEEVGQQGWNLLRGDLPLPACVLKLSALENNSRWMQSFVRERGALIAPHVKTTMCPPIIRRQLADGAWAATVATLQQMLVCREMGVSRIILANQPVGPAELTAITSELARDPGFDFYCLADSVEGVGLVAQAAAAANLNRPIQLLLEVGFQNGRAGARGVERAMEVARAIHAARPHLALVGVEGFEGLLPTEAATGQATVGSFLAEMAEVFRRCREEKLFDIESPIISAGGSLYYDRVLDAFAGLGGRVVTRSGCYVTHDSGQYENAYQEMKARLHEHEGPMRAIELWVYVQSRPEPGLALLTAGRRDFGHDSGFPIPLLHSRGGEAPRPIERLGWEVVKANDQHAYLRIPAAADLRIGDRLGLGVSHPCTTLDKWRLLLVVDDRYTVVDAYPTCF